MSKNAEVAALGEVVPESASDDVVLGEKQGTSRDVEDMKRMGKEQLFKRNFGFLSIFGFAMILMNTWQALLGTIAFGLGNGGTAGLIYLYIVVVIFFTLVNISMAEMASMAPTAGGQYHWISEFAPRSQQRLLSFIVGWLCTLGWQSGVAIGCFLAATEIQGLIVLNNDSYVYERWHGTLLTIAIVLFIAFFNTFLAKHLPLVEGMVLCLHIGGFICILVPLWVLGPRGNSHEIWTVFQDGGGWGSTGLATLVGIITPATAFLGADAAVHMAEELRNASKTLPRVMLWTSIVNGALGFIMLITFCYTLGDLNSVLSTPTGYPFIQVFYNATGSKGGATAMSCILVLSAVANGMTNMATASRQLFAFARDKGLPFHTWFAKVGSRFEIPINAVLFTVCFSVLFSLVNIGSTVAFNQILSLGVAALLSSYFISIACVTWRRVCNQPLLDRVFDLGRFGIPINLAALAFLALAFTMSFFPGAAHPTPQTMNWSSLAYGSVIIIGGVYYVFWARHQYVGPVEYVRKSA
ncbi:uncharacterized protein A1O5_11652 [Cladophialophora psammophila CBS 110553]|uniref:Amino acid permease/ SLC12A domain-containing protein n=1 Tax=Cladophialophora psammophila CBS 110553 TaxID=1182543 RepID=W9WFJ4_9EURO|nr:uncharacterized protein A1O5_11652 [Cladophialophora psammophila CBS 110553]EXJ63331.1 hypothetical protein A1O5_11652 [Cladophialophora psammophila CBS 110553]